jgi:photosystem II stability/assembly factor-like uncharacterized protein
VTGVQTCALPILETSSDGKYISACRNVDTVSEVSKYGIFCSSDFGITWVERGSNTFPNSRLLSIAMSSSGQYQITTEFGNSHNWVYLSRDYGKTWNKITVDSSTFTTTTASMSSSGKYQAIAGGFYYYGSSTSSYIYYSSDYGATWTKNTAIGLKNWSSISMSSSGRYQTAVAGSNYIYISSDYGVTWTSTNTSIGTQNWSCVSISASGQYQTACVGTSSQNGFIYGSID